MLCIYFARQKVGKTVSYDQNLGIKKNRQFNVNFCLAIPVTPNKGKLLSDIYTPYIFMAFSTTGYILLICRKISHERSISIINVFLI